MKSKNFRIMGVAVLLTAVAAWYWTSSRADSFEDANGNGVRDDVEAKILEKYGNHSENMVKALFQRTRAMQKASSEADMTKERAYQIADEMDKGRGCQIFIDNHFDEDMDIEEWVVNTYARARIYNRFNAFFSGTMLSETPEGNTCDFEVQ